MALRAVPVPPPPTQSPERETLREASERVRAATARRAALTSALHAAEAAAIAAHHAVEAAEAAVTESKSATARHLVEAASGTVGDPPRSTRAARNALEDARDELDARRAARDELKRQQAEANNTGLYHMQLQEAAAAVLKAEWQSKGDAMVAEVIEAYAGLVEKCQLVRGLAGAGLVERSRNQVGDPAAAVARLGSLEFVPGCEQARAAGAARFRAMFEALQANADAPLASCPLRDPSGPNVRRT